MALSELRISVLPYWTNAFGARGTEECRHSAERTTRKTHQEKKIKKNLPERAGWSWAVYILQYLCAQKSGKGTLILAPQ